MGHFGGGGVLRLGREHEEHRRGGEEWRKGVKGGWPRVGGVLKDHRGWVCWKPNSGPKNQGRTVGIEGIGGYRMTDRGGGREAGKGGLCLVREGMSEVDTVVARNKAR